MKMNCRIATGINPCCWLLEAMHSNKPSSRAAACVSYNCHWPAAWYTLSLSRSGILRTIRAVVHVFLHEYGSLVIKTIHSAVRLQKYMSRVWGIGYLFIFICFFSFNLELLFYTWLSWWVFPLFVLSQYMYLDDKLQIIVQIFSSRHSKIQNV